MVNRQNFPTKILHLENFGIALLIFTNLSRLGLSRRDVMSEHGILKYFHPILDKKDPPEGKELVSPSYLIHLGHYQRVYHRHQSPLRTLT